LRWGPTPSACHRSLTLAALFRDDCLLSPRSDQNSLHPVTACSRSRRCFATIVCSVRGQTRTPCTLSPPAHARGVVSRRLSAQSAFRPGLPAPCHRPLTLAAPIRHDCSLSQHAISRAVN